MNVFFNSVGFSNLKAKTDIINLVNTILKNYDDKYILNHNNDVMYSSFYKYYGSNFGLCIKGFLDANENFELYECLPFFNSKLKVKTNSIECVEHNTEYFISTTPQKNCDSLTFKIVNTLEYFNNIQSINQDYFVNISGMSVKGTVILPLEKNNAIEDRLKLNLKSTNINTSNNIDTKSSLHDILNDKSFSIDLLTYINTFCIHMGKYSEYSILGDILKVKTTRNTLTQEVCYIITIGLPKNKFEIVINKDTLVGYPSVGMRFMGTCSLQGNIIINN